MRGKDALRDSLGSSDNPATFKVLPDYIRHIESEVKSDIKALEKRLIDQGKSLKKQFEETQEQSRLEFEQAIEGQKRTAKRVKDKLEQQLSQIEQKVGDLD